MKEAFRISGDVKLEVGNSESISLEFGEGPEDSAVARNTSDKLFLVVDKYNTNSSIGMGRAMVELIKEGNMELQDVFILASMFITEMNMRNLSIEKETFAGWKEELDRLLESLKVGK